MTRVLGTGWLGDPSAVWLVALVTRTHGGEPGGGSGDPVTLEPSDLKER